MPNKILLDYQRNWILSPARYKIWEKARQIGATYAEALWSVDRRILSKMNHVFSSANGKTSEEFIAYCKQWANVYNIIVQEEIIDIDGSSTKCLTMPNGSKITAMTSNPTALRGFKADLTIDEFAWHEHAEALYIAAQPVITWGGHLHIISTHSSRESIFNKIVVDSRAGLKPYEVHRITIYDALEQGLAEVVPGDHQLYLPDVTRCREEYLKNLKAIALNEHAFKQEYCADFNDEATVITPANYDACLIPNHTISRKSIELDKNKCGDLFIGVDVARSETGDNTSMWVLEHGIDPKQDNPYLRNIYRTVCVLTLKGQPFSVQRQYLSNLINFGKIKKVLIEKNGIGIGLLDQFAEEHSEIVTGFLTTNASKQLIVERLSGFVDQHRIVVPKDDDLRADLLALKRIVSASGKVSYVGQSGSSHCDGFISCALALQAAESMKNANFSFTSI